MFRQAIISAINTCWFCNHNNTSITAKCEDCKATTLPTKSTTQLANRAVTATLEWDTKSPPQEHLSLTWRMQTMERFRGNDGTAVRVGEGVKRVMFVRNHKGEKSVSWDSKANYGTKIFKTKTKEWHEMGVQQWAEVRGVLAGLDGGVELVNGMENT